MSNNMRTEIEYLPLCLKIINDYPGITTSEMLQIIRNEDYLILSDCDKEILPSRSDERFTQIVRNLTGSHSRSNEFGRCVSIKGEGRNRSFYLNERGRNSLISLHRISDIRDDLTVEEISNNSDYLDAINNRTPQLTASEQPNVCYKRNSSIAKFILYQNNYMCEYATLTKQQHITFDKPNHILYVEAHHLFPFSYQADFENTNIDRIENLVALCPNCHRAVHHGNMNIKKKIIKPIFDLKIPNLIQISKKFDYSFENFMNKYYN